MRCDLLGCALGERPGGGIHRRDRAIDSLAHDRGPGDGRTGQPAQPVADGSHVRFGQETFGAGTPLVDDEQRGIAELVPPQHLRQMRGDGVTDARWNPIEHESDGRTACLRGTQKVPGNRVGIAGRRRNKEPQVGGGEQLLGKGAISLDHGVDIGRVEQGEAGIEAGRRDDAECSGVALGIRRTHEVGKEVRLGEPPGVIGVADQHRSPSGRTQHAAGADGRLNQAVDQSGLARPGRPADDDEQRRIQPRQAGQQIVVELGDDAVGGASGFVGARQSQREPNIRNG